jgi:histidinol dehydrogenase
MAITHLKRGKTDEARSEDDAKVRASVESILEDIETRGDAAVRELSEKFDKYAPPSFRLSESEIEPSCRACRPTTSRISGSLRRKSATFCGHSEWGGGRVMNPAR